MYAAFALTTRIPARRLTDHAPLLRAHGLTPVREVHRLSGFLAATLWQKGA
jgi:hypothetical protein